MKLKPLVLLLAASVLASGCSQTVKSTLDAPTDVTYQVADEDASGIPIVEPDAALNPATMPTVAQLILIEYGKTSVTQFEALLGSPQRSSRFRRTRDLSFLTRTALSEDGPRKIPVF